MTVIACVAFPHALGRSRGLVSVRLGGILPSQGSLNHRWGMMCHRHARGLTIHLARAAVLFSYAKRHTCS